MLEAGRQLTAKRLDRMMDNARVNYEDLLDDQAGTPLLVIYSSSTFGSSLIGNSIGFPPAHVKVADLCRMYSA